MLEAAIAAGVTAAGGDVLLGGVLPTPAAPLLIAPLRVRPRGGHLRLRTTRTATTASSSSAPTASSSPTRPRRRSRPAWTSPHPAEPAESASGRAPPARHAGGLPARAARRASRELDLDGRRRPAGLRQRRDLPRRPRRSSGAWARRVTALADEPDGRNINDGCGSTHVEALARAVVEGGHELGFAFDGDGDRVLAVDRTGRGRRRRRADRAGGAAPARRRAGCPATAWP